MRLFAALLMMVAITCAAPARAHDLAQDLLAAVNGVRQSHGLRALAPSAALRRAAQALANDLAARGALEHQNARGDDLETRLSAVGYAYASAAENLAAGQTAPAAVVDDWMQSPGHQRNLLLADVSEAGIAVVRLPFARTGPRPNVRPIYWVLIVAEPRR